MISRILPSEADTAKLAQEIAALALGGKTIALEGDLGAGKTTLVRHLVAALGGRAEDVSSPTFSLEHDYEVRQGAQVEHWDLYRLSSAPQELLEPPGPAVIRVIEWASRCPELASTNDLTVLLRAGEAGQRTAEISGLLEGGLLR